MSSIQATAEGNLFSPIEYLDNSPNTFKIGCSFFIHEPIIYTELLRSSHCEGRLVLADAHQHTHVGLSHVPRCTGQPNLANATSVTALVGCNALALVANE